MSKKDIDDLDKGIIKLLSKDGRMSFTEIANRLDVTEKTIRTRFNNLIDNKMIDIVGIVNPISLGLKVGAIVQIKVDQNKINEIIEKLNSINGVRYVSLIAGEYQLLIQVNVHDYDGLTDTVKELYKIDGILTTQVLLQLDVYKNTFEYI